MKTLQIPCGSRFGKLLTTGAVLPRLAKLHWECVCDCGKLVTVDSWKLRSGYTKSCGCIKVKHLQSSINRTPEYALWISIKQRCFNRNYHHYVDYGGRGITVCKAWKDSFDTFFLAIGRRPSPDHSLDRFPDNDGNYEPGNVRWATRSQQQRNKRRSFKEKSNVKT